MLHHKTIRRVHEWAVKQVDGTTVYKVMEGLGIVKSTANNSMLALMRAGFAKREELPAPELRPGVPPQPTQYLWRVSGTAAEVAKAFGRDLPKPRPDPGLIAAAPSVFAYGDRCAAAAAKGGE